MDLMTRSSTRQGSMQSTMSTTSMNDLPNLPGMRRSASSINPKMYKEYKAATAVAAPTPAPETGGSTGKFEDGELMFDEYDSYYDDAQSKLMQFSRSLSAFPKEGSAYNDATGGRYSLISQKEDRERKQYTIPYDASTGSLKNTYVTSDKRVLSYVAYFSENYAKASGAGEQSRKVLVKLYLEDNSLEVVEPRVENSGGPAGKFLKRHQVLRPVSKSPSSGQGPVLYTYEDFYAGAVLSIYNRDYYIVDADQRTKNFLADMNFDFGSPTNLPDSIYDPKTRPGMPRKPSKKESKKKGGKNKTLGFFEYDRKVLRFFGQWDCRDTLFGDDLRVKLHYSLADGSIEIVPMHERNNGRDKVPKFMKNNPIMKPRDDFLETQGSIVDSYSLQGYSSTGIISSGSMLALLGEGPGIEPATPYHWTDLKIGEVIPVAAYNIVLIDADEFTRAFYASKEMDLEAPIIPPPPVYPDVSNEPPPL